MKFKIAVIAMVVAMLAVIGCAGIQNKDGKEAYALAVTSYGSIVSDYNKAYDAATTDVKAKWHDTIDPKVQMAYRALKTWGAALDTAGEDTARREYNRIFTEIVTMLVDMGAIEIRG